MSNTHGGSPVLTNCTFSNNSASSGGWGMLSDGGSSTLTNCTFYGNKATSGGEGEGEGETDGGAVRNQGASNMFLRNCILWGNGDEISNEAGSYTFVQYGDVQGGYAGTGNIDADPLFMDAAHGDLRLQAGSPCIDTGTANNAPSTDNRGAHRPQGARFDMGAYEMGFLAAFSAMPVGGYAPLSVQFSDASTTDSPVITDWNWDFGDTNTSTDRNPVYTYNTPGIYTVSLSISSPGEFSDTETKTAYITVLPPVPPEANFYISNAWGRPPHEVSFVDASTPGTSPIFDWTWNFGEGPLLTGEYPNPTHVYEQMGVYTVSLTVTTLVGSSTKTFTDVIVISDQLPLAPWTLLVTAIILGALAVQCRKLHGQEK